MKRYQQQLILPEIGIAGQQNISNASVLIVGAGGLGSMVGGYVAAMGVGNIGICDFDSVEESNLHRQFFYTPGDIGNNKAIILTQKLKMQNPGIIITSFNRRFNASGADDLFNNYEIICDCSDNVETRIALNDYSGNRNIPLIHGAVSGWQGYITVFNYKASFTYADLFSSEDLLNSQSCFNNGINSTICGIVGSYMANETLKIILSSDFVLEGKLLYINGLNNSMKLLKLKKVNSEI